MNEIPAIIEIIQNLGFVGLLIVLAIPKLRRIVFNGNGNSKELKELKDNHLYHIQSSLEELKLNGKEEIFLLKEMNRKIEKIYEKKR